MSASEWPLLWLEPAEAYNASKSGGGNVIELWPSLLATVYVYEESWVMKFSRVLKLTYTVSNSKSHPAKLTGFVGGRLLRSPRGRAQSSVTKPSQPPSVSVAERHCVVV